jgi:hypothetical protein
LTTSNVNVSTFGKLFCIPVDGYVFAQPLYQPAMTMSDGKVHNVLYVATANDSVYAFDADSGLQIWKDSLGTPVPANVANPNVGTSNSIGITGTPVIDSTTNEMYVVTRTYTNGSQAFQIHALDVTTGAELSSATISASVAGTGYQGAVNGEDGFNGIVNFNAQWQNQRAAVTLGTTSDGKRVVYVAFGSNADINPWHGWVMAYSASTLEQIAVFNTTPNGAQGAIWMSGQGLLVDGEGSVYMITANSGLFGYANTPLSLGFNLITYVDPGDYGQSFLKLSGQNLSYLDYFRPFTNDYVYLNVGDEDLGAGGGVLINGATATYMVGAGKQGILYVVNTATGKMGELATYEDGPDNIAQEFQATTGFPGNPSPNFPNCANTTGCGNGLWGSPVFWNNTNGITAPTLYIWGANDVVKAYSFDMGSGMFYPRVSPHAQSSPVTPSSSSTVSSPATPNGDTSGALSISANGNNDGILWATIPTADPSVATVGGILYAFDATNVGSELWNSRQAPALRDDFANFAKFVPPTIANGKVYVATFSYQVCAYGTNPPAPAWHQTDIVANDMIVTQTPISPYPNLTVGTAPTASGDPAAFVFSTGAAGNQPTENVVYRDTNTSGGAGTGHVQLLTSFGNQAQWSAIDLTLASGAPPAAGNPSGYVSFNGTAFLAQNVVYRAANNHIYLVFLPSGNTTWQYADLTATSAAPVAATDPIGSASGNSQVVNFVGSDGHVHQLYTTNAAATWIYDDLTAVTGTTTVTGNTTEFAFGGAAQIVAARTTSGDILELSTLNSQWVGSDITALSSAPTSSSNPSAYATGGYQYVNYRGADNHIHQISSSGNSGPWTAIDLTTLAGAANALGDPSGSASAAAQSVAYRGSDSDIHLLYPNSSQWAVADLSALASAPAAAGDPFQYFFNTQAVVYRGTDGHIHQLFVQ